MTETQGDRAERLTAVALDLATAVRDEPRDDLAKRLAAIADVDKDALILVLAGFVDIDQPPSQLLAWVTWDEHGSPLLKPQRVKSRLARYVDRLAAGDDEAALKTARAAFVNARRIGVEPEPWMVEGNRAYRKRYDHGRAVA